MGEYATRIDEFTVYNGRHPWYTYNVAKLGDIEENEK